MAEVILLVLHGMGDTKRGFAQPLIDGLTDRLQRRAAIADVHVAPVYYQPVFQQEQERLWRDMRALAPIDQTKLRKFVLYGFSDAAALERNAASQGSPYEAVQIVIRDALEAAFTFVGGSRPVVVVAQSLGGQVLSNYLWDAQQPAGASRGVWRGAAPSGTDLDDFLRLKTMKFLYTTGCNIPIFLGGFAKGDIRPVKHASGGWSFKWKNFYDEDDVLGWPLRPLNAAYARAIDTEEEVNVGSVFSSWNPLSHSHYWRDIDVLQPLARDLRTLGIDR